MPVAAIIAHLLGVIVWVGGMFFAYMAARPALGQLDTTLRARVWVGIFQRFFPWVWASVALILGSGIYMVFNTFDGFAHAPVFVHVMMGLGLLMMALFGHVFFAPYGRLKRAVATGDDALASAAMGQIRMTMLVNLILGIIVVIVAMSGAYLATD